MTRADGQVLDIPAIRRVRRVTEDRPDNQPIGIIAFRRVGGLDEGCIHLHYMGMHTYFYYLYNIILQPSKKEKKENKKNRLRSGGSSGRFVRTLRTLREGGGRLRNSFITERFGRGEWFVVENTYRGAVHRFGVAYASGVTQNSGRPCWFVLLPHKTSGKDHGITNWTYRNTKRRDDMRVFDLIGDYEFRSDVKRRQREDRVYVRHTVTGRVGSYTRASEAYNIKTGRVHVRLLDGRSTEIRRSRLEEIGEAAYREAEAAHRAAPVPPEKASWRRCEICGGPINPDPLVDGGWRRHMACHRALIERIHRAEERAEAVA